MTVVFQSKFLLLQLKAPRACRIWNAEVRACSCRTEVGLKDKDLPHLNWSALIGDEPCSICPLCAGGVNLLLQIPWQEDQTDRQTDRLPVTAGLRRQGLPVPQPGWVGVEIGQCPSAVWNSPLLKETTVCGTSTVWFSGRH